MKQSAVPKLFSLRFTLFFSATLCMCVCHSLVRVVLNRRESNERFPRSRSIDHYVAQLRSSRFVLYDRRVTNEKYVHSPVDGARRISTVRGYEFPLFSRSI